jgi:hypothetical protein
MRNPLARLTRTARRRDRARIEPAPSRAGIVYAEHSHADPEGGPDFDRDQDRADWLAADAGAEADNANAAAAYGWLYAGYQQALDEYAAAREVLPGLPPAVIESVNALQERQGRPVTLAEVRWLEYYVSEASK